MKQHLKSSTTGHSVYAEMADALDLLDKAYEIIDNLVEGMNNYHGSVPEDLDNWRARVSHCINMGDQIRPDYKYVDYFARR